MYLCWVLWKNIPIIHGDCKSQDLVECSRTQGRDGGGEGRCAWRGVELPGKDGGRGVKQTRR